MVILSLQVAHTTSEFALKHNMSDVYMYAGNCAIDEGTSQTRVSEGGVGVGEGGVIRRQNKFQVGITARKCLWNAVSHWEARIYDFRVCSRTQH